jgi:HPt (histidine-containing phosphotransfer) domain-containing protein
VTADATVQEMLRGLEALGTPGLARQVLEVFFRDSSCRLTALRDGLGRRDFNAMYEAAHSMQGSASMVGATALAEQCRQVAEAARARSFERCEALAAGLNTSLESIRQAAG